MTLISPIDTLVLIPTFNERENIQIIVKRVQLALPNAHLLFIDDASPDGTGKMLDELSLTDLTIHVLHRARKLGVGSAHLHGIRWAFERSVDVLITLDADLSHSPEDANRMMTELEHTDVVVGSRFIGHGGLQDWGLSRKFMTHLGHLLTYSLLRIPYDSSGGFRVYNISKLNKEIFELVQSTNYAFFFESLKILHMNHISIGQVPIVLPARTYGHSKMGLRDVFQSLGFLLRLSILTLIFPSRYRIKNEQ
jgi:dolichol-phosphate mannosyltransferase